MKYGIYKNEWSSAIVDPFATFVGEMTIKDNAFYCYKDNRLVAVYPTFAFYVVVLEDEDV